MKFPCFAALAVLVLAGCSKAPSAGKASEEPDHKHLPAVPVETTIAKAEELGLATTVEELQASRTESVDLAGPIYAKLKNLAESAHAITLDRYTKAQATDEEADKAMAALDKEFAIMEQAANAPTFAPKRDFSLGVQIQYPEYDAIQRTAAAFAARAMRSARKGSLPAASADLERAAKVVAHAASEDLAMSEYLTTICLDHWARAATTIAVEAPSLRDTIATMAASLPTVDARKGVGTDFALIKATIDKIKSGETTYSKVAGLSSPAMVEGKPMDDLLAKNMKQAEGYALAYVVAAYEKWNDRKQIMEMLHAAEHASQQESQETTALHAFEALAMTFTAPLKNGEALTQAQIECLRIAIAADKLRRASGKVPTIEQAAKAAGCGDIDPFRGSPYQLKEIGGKITVYSVGLDEKDDGGKPYVPGETKGTDVSVSL